MGQVRVTLTIDGKEYVAIPRADYLRMTVGKDLEGAVDAVKYMRRALGNTLRAAREAADLTQAELAERLGTAQSTVSATEAGRVRIGERYVANRIAGVRPAEELEAGQVKPTTHALTATRARPEAPPLPASKRAARCRALSVECGIVAPVARTDTATCGEVKPRRARKSRK
jgi:transcriptional regulator with XRE-family HTH domain